MMKFSFISSLRTFPLLPSLLALTIGLGLTGCQTEEAEPTYTPVEITANGMVFDAPDTIASGWQTLHFKNNSAMVHFAVLERMPAGQDVRSQQEEVAPVFQNIMDDINGNPISAPEAGFEVPSWFSDVVFLGGPGLLAGPGSSETTVYIEPGTYMIECYVKTDGVFHSYNPDPNKYGMVHGLVVTGDTTTLEEPTPTLELTISSQDGIQMNGTPEAGDQVVKVTFKDQKAYANFVGHDVHLAQLSNETNLDSLGAWMNWTIPKGLQTPAPATFMGGVNEMPAGGVAYIHVNLEPGKYAWIAEVPNPADEGMLKTFSVE